MARPNIPQVVIKKYANRRLYNTSTSTYVTLEDLCNMVKEGIDFGVYDAKTGEDLTRPVLTQIIVEQEAKGTNLLPTPFLKQLISFYGGNMQMLVPKFLEETMRTFVGNQERFQRQFTETFGGIFPINQFSEIGKQNMAMMERAMRMMNPFVAGEGGAQAPNGAGNGHAQAHAHHQGHGHGQKEADVTRLKSQLDELQKQINSLQKRPGAK